MDSSRSVPLYTHHFFSRPTTYPSRDIDFRKVRFFFSEIFAIVLCPSYLFICAWLVFLMHLFLLETVSQLVLQLYLEK